MALTLMKAIKLTEDVLAGSGIGLWMAVLRYRNDHSEKAQRAREEAQLVLKASKGLRTGNYQPAVKWLDYMITIQSQPGYPKALLAMAESQTYSLVDLRNTLSEAQKEQIITGGPTIELPQLDLDTTIASCRELFNSLARFLDGHREVTAAQSSLDTDDYQPAIDLLNKMVDSVERYECLELEQMAHGRYWSIVELRDFLVQAQKSKNAASP